jgi:hypothetical protein
MHAAKAAGEIEKFPCGGNRQAEGLPPLSKNKHIRKAQRLVEAQMSRRAAIVAAGLTKAERLGSAVDTALEVATEILALGVDPTDPRVLAIVKDTALSIIATQARLDAAALQAASGGVASFGDDDLDERIERRMRLVRALEAEEEAEGIAADDISDIEAGADVEVAE